MRTATILSLVSADLGSVFASLAKPVSAKNSCSKAMKVKVVPKPKHWTLLPFKLAGRPYLVDNCSYNILYTELLVKTFTNFRGWKAVITKSLGQLLSVKVWTYLLSANYLHILTECVAATTDSSFEPNLLVKYCGTSILSLSLPSGLFNGHKPWVVGVD